MDNKLEPAIEAVARASGADNSTIQRLLRALRGDEVRRCETYLNAGEVAQRLGWHRKTVLRHSRQLGAIHRSKRCIRFPLSAVERFAAEGGV
jgi:hypothetical protein